MALLDAAGIARLLLVRKALVEHQKLMATLTRHAEVCKEVADEIRRAATGFAPEKEDGR